MILYIVSAVVLGGIAFWIVKLIIVVRKTKAKQKRYQQSCEECVKQVEQMSKNMDIMAKLEQKALDEESLILVLSDGHQGVSQPSGFRKNIGPTIENGIMARFMAGMGEYAPLNIKDKHLVYCGDVENPEWIGSVKAAFPNLKIHSCLGN
jgi:hypothetical protein